MLEVSGISHKDGENCIDIIYKICKLTLPNMRFKDRLARNLLYSNQLKLKEKYRKDLGFKNETSIK